MKHKNLVLFFSILLCLQGLTQKQKVWLDADTGNEMDDLYAIVRLVKDTTVDMIGLSSSHFNNADLLVFEKWNGYYTKDLNTVAESQRLNELILKALNTDIPHPVGADRQTGRAWGQQDARPSPASAAIIAAVKNLPLNEKLDILTLGALTNMATAVMIAPEITPRIRCFSLGAKYSVKTKVWDKSEFNIRNDLNAFDYLLNLEGFEFIIMPLQTAFPLQFNRDQTYNRLNENIPVEKILEDRWKEQNPQDTIRVMWDLALVEAYLQPVFSKIGIVNPPPENKKRKIKVITAINEEELYADFWNILKQ
ncbi:MAG: nucleoside hydrolase [Chitinophagaceae bacterium]